MALSLQDLIHGLVALRGGTASGPQANGAPTTSQVTGPTPSGDSYIQSAPQSTTVAPITVAAGPTTSPDDASFNRSVYNNLPEVMMARRGQAQTGVSEGFKGTLRDVLGSFGDAMLVHAGKPALYAPAKKEHEIADAMIGFQADPRAAAGRLAAVPGADQEAMKMLNEQDIQDLKKQQEQGTLSYRNSVLDDRRQAHEDAATARREAQAQRLIPYAGAILTDPSIKTPQDYAKAHAKVDAMFKRIGPDYSPADAGAVDPADWTPEMQKNLGMTSGQVGRIGVSEDSIGERRQAASNRDATTRAGQGITADRPSLAATIDRLLKKQNNHEDLTPAEQQLWDAQTKGKTGNKARIVPAGLVPPAPAGSGTQPKMVIRNGKLVPK